TLDLPIEATTTYEKWQAALRDELGARYSDLVGERTWVGVETKYSALPEVGLSLARIKHNVGTIREFTELSFRDVETGRFVKYETAQSMIGEWWGR
ncbi:unnamed protein product, partial [marine sediment metagenome]